MDKYTVDLDQVLNDFEYYELTDNSKTVPEKSQNNVQYQPPPVTAKHSINNVFHSLNEYLNSSVGVNSGAPSSSFLQENKSSVIGASDNNKPVCGTQEEFGDVISQTVNNKRIGNNIYVEENYTKNEKVIENTVTAELEKPKSSNEKESFDASEQHTTEIETPAESEGFKDVNIKSECDSYVIEPDGLLVQEEDQNSIDTCKENAETNHPVSKVISVESIENNETVLVNITGEAGAEHRESEYSNNVLGIKQQHDFIIEPSGSFMQSDCVGDDKYQEVAPTKGEEIIESQRDVLCEESTNEIMEDQIQDNLNNTESDSCSLTSKEDPSTNLNEDDCLESQEDDLENKKDLVEEQDEKVESTPPTAETCPKEQNGSVNIDNSTGEHNSDMPEQPKPATFYVQNIEIDESELTKMLEDLELEEERNNEQVVPPIESLTLNVTDEPNQDKSNGDEIQNIQEETTKGADEKHDLVEHKPDVANESKKHAEPRIIGCLEVEKPKKIKSTEKVKNSQEIEINEAKPIDECKQEGGSNELGESSEPSEETQSRPDTLPLINEIKGGEKTGRKINLIGSPGSTPYNNVYVNKSIKKSKTQDGEPTAYTSCSVSPTFSDCSTESTSTASTVSVEDDPNNSERFIKKPLKVKNVNIENEVARMQGAVGKQKNNESQPEGTEDPNEGATGVTEQPSREIVEGLNRAGAEGDSNASDKSWLGKEAPLWIPDADAASCLHCDTKFTIVKRRHHCRACGLVLCSKCCNMKQRLEYLDAEARVCNKCYEILNKDASNNAPPSTTNSPEAGNSPFRPNPNNPLEYCSTISPLQQAGQTGGVPPPSVMVPVGVLKRKGSNKKANKSVMFCDGIAPGSDLTNLDQDFNYNKTPGEVKKAVEPVEAAPPAAENNPALKITRNQTKIDKETGCHIPKCETSLPPTISRNKTDISYSDCSNSLSVVEMLKNESLTFAITQNLFVHLKIIDMNCCINKQAWCFTSEGLINVGSDEVVYLIEYIEDESFVPKDVFFHIHNVYLDAVKGVSVKELGLSLHDKPNFLDSRNHAGFVYIKPSFQCLENVIVPIDPYLVGILIHRWETPWAKLFPLRLILRLGAEYRYYPSPLISTRHRDSVFVEIGHTIINLLADFRNFSYTLPQIRGLIIHMEDKKTTITIPRNRYDQVTKSISNSSEHILAFAGNFSAVADSHLVCIQDTQGHENSYATHAINIHNKPRKVTGASFIVFNGSLKSSSGLTAKSNIVEDGLMIQVPSEHMDKLRENLRLMKNHTIACGCVNAESDETVNIIWGENDTDFNNGVKSPVDNSDMKGVPSIRVHNGKDYVSNNGARLIRWTEVFIIQSGEENSKNQDPVDISKVSEGIAKACCTALVKYLDLLVTNSCHKIGIRTTLHVENVSYSAGSSGTKLTPIYMRSLDNELIPVLHRITSNNLGDNAIVLELIFRILNA